MTAPGRPYHSVLLVGFMGSGKSTVGRRSAALLGWDFLDIDDLVEERAGRSVEDIFRQAGEHRFRELEDELTREALRTPHRVLSPGGGWSVAEGRLESVDPGVLTVWLRVDAETAIRRAGAEDRVRPLLEVGDPVGRARELMDERVAAYRKARLHLDSTGAGPEELAESIVRCVKRGPENS
jgi:shikimate kinase